MSKELPPIGIHVYLEPKTVHLDDNSNAEYITVGPMSWRWQLVTVASFFG
jgi:hypothetical protein